MKNILPSVICAVAMLIAHIAPAAARVCPVPLCVLTAAQIADERAAERERCKADPRNATRNEGAQARVVQSQSQRCEEMKAKMKQRQEQCKADPQKCRDEMKARREGGARPIHSAAKR